MSRRSRTAVIPPPDLMELSELPPDPGPAWPDPPIEALVPPPPPPFAEGCIIGGDPGLVEVLIELLEAAEAPAPAEEKLLSEAELSARADRASSRAGDVPARDLCLDDDRGDDRSIDLDQLVREMWWDRDDAERALLGTNPPAWATAPAGPDLATALALVRLNTASPVTLIEVMKATTRMQAWAEAMTTAAMAAFWQQRKTEAAARAEEDDPHYSTPAAKADPMRGAAAEIAAALRLSPRTVHGRIADAVRLTTTLAETFAALRAGQITLTKARVLLDGTEHLSPAHQRAVQRRVLGRAPGQTGPQLNAAIRRACAAVDPDGENERHERAKRNREITIRPLADGMAELSWIDSADVIHMAWIALTCLADAAKRSRSDQDPAADYAGAADHDPDHRPDHGAADSADTGAGSRDPGSSAAAGSGDPERQTVDQRR